MGIWEYTLYLTTTACLWSGKKPNGHLSTLLYGIMFNNSSCLIVRLQSYSKCLQNVDYNISAATVTSNKVEVCLYEHTSQNIYWV